MQITQSITTLALAATLVGVTLPQDESPPEGLVRVEVDEPQVELEAWRERLTQPDLERREERFGELVASAAEDLELQHALREWASGSDELAWTSRLALRELERTGRGARPDASQRDFFGAPFGGRMRTSLDDSRDLLRELEERLNDAFREFDSMAPFSSAPPLRPGSGGGFSRSESFKMESTPDGVRIEIEEDEDGEKVTNTYEGKTLEEILDANPELRDKIDVRAPFGSPFGSIRPFERGFDSRFFPRRDDTLRDPRSGLIPRTLDASPRTDVLGVRVANAPRELDGVAPGVGLEVVDTLPGTIAREIGIRNGDVLIELNGRALESTEDVRQVLQSRGAREDLNVTLIDTAGARRTLTWSPPARVF